MSFKTFSVLGCLVVFAMGTVSCNLFGRLDPPHSNVDAYTAAIAAGNAGDCAGAVAILVSIATPNDDVYAALGWAYLCVANATAANIASSLYSYTSTTSNYKVVGTLANSLLPTSTAQTTALTNATNAFSSINDATRRNINLAIGEFVSAAQLLANQASIANDNVLHGIDVSVSACSGFSTNCAGSGATCAPGLSGGMSDTDVTTFINLISQASTNLSSSNAGDLQNLANALNSNLPLGSPSLARCFIFNDMIP